MRVAIYLRVNTENQMAYNYSLITQKETCISKARELGATNITEFIDKGFSGDTLDRPSLNALRQAVSNSSFDVIISNPCRLSRNSGHQLLLNDEFAKAGTELIFTDAEGIKNEGSNISKG